MSRDVRSRAKSSSLCHTARKCVHPCECVTACGRPFGRLFRRVHRHAHTNTRALIYTRAPQTRTYVHTRPPRHGLKGRDPNHFPKLLVDGGRVTRRLTFHCRPRAAGRAIEGHAARRTGKKLKTQLDGLSIGRPRRFDFDLTRRRMFRV